MRPIALVALLLALAAAGGADAASRTTQTGVVQGMVSRGPACSKQQLHPCPSPLSDVKIVFVRHGRAAARTTTDTFGSYRIRLRAGLYAIELPGRDRWLPTRVTVAGGRVTQLDISIGTSA